MNKIAFLTTVLTLAALTGQDIHAQRRVLPSPEAPAALPATDYAALASGPRFTSGPETYVIMPAVHAIQAPAGGQTLQEALDALGVSGKAVGRKGAFVIYRDALTQAGAAPRVLAARRAGRGMAQPVVFNPRTRQVGVVLGTLLVHLADMDTAAAVGQAAGLTSGLRFDHLGIAVYAVPAGQDILAAAQALQGDPRVQSVQIEVLEKLPRAA